MKKGKYIYCVIGVNRDRKDLSNDKYKFRKKYNSPGIGGKDNEVYNISYQDITAVVSSSPDTSYSISRKNLICHQKILEELMENYTVLPVRFDTVAVSKNGICTDERIKEEVLEDRYKEFKDLLAKMDDKVELGIKASWIDMQRIFQEIVEENKDIKKLRNNLLLKSIERPYGKKATLGEMVIHALEGKKLKEEKDILKVLKENYVDKRSNKVFGDKMITNFAFLVEKPKVEEFDRLVDKLTATYDGRIKFKYVGPVPPINFVELVISLKE